MASIRIAQLLDEVSIGEQGAYSFKQLGRAARGDYDNAREARIAEAMSSSDFAHIADTVDRGLMVGYLEADVSTNFETLGRRRDTVGLARAGGKGEGWDYRLSAAREIPVVGEGAEYLPIEPSEEKFELLTRKRGCQWDITFETWLADSKDFGMLSSYPRAWGYSARYTQQMAFTTAFAGNTDLFAADHSSATYAFKNPNILTGAGTALSIDTLAAAIAMARTMRDPQGNVVPYAGKLHLVVPSAILPYAQAITSSQTIANVLTAALTPSQSPVFASKVNVIEDTFLAAVDPNYEKATGQYPWYLFCDPDIRPALRYGHLQGYTEPEIYIKSGDAQALMTGAEDPFSGSFLSDMIEFKLRFFWGTDVLDYRGAVMSEGLPAAPLD